jgi:predicted phosphodiesterase
LNQHPVDHIVCLGDAIQGGAQPAETASRLRSLDCPVVLGNADAWLSSGDENTLVQKVSPAQRAIREWTFAQLTPDDRAFLGAFQHTLEINLGISRPLLCFHGSPSSYNDILLPTTREDEFQQIVGDYDQFILAGGHTHLQQIRRWGETLFFNPGSVGFVYDRQWQGADFRLCPWAEYAILSVDGSGIGLEFRRVPVEIAELLLTIRVSGRPDAEILAGWYEQSEQSQAISQT